MEPENPGMEIAKSFAEGAGKESANKIAAFFSSLFPYWGLKKKAVDAYVREIEQSNLPPEMKLLAITNTRKTLEELNNQTAIIDVAYSAIGSGQAAETDDPPAPDRELVSRLIDAARFVYDEELQLLWGHVLAGELENPCGTPKM